MSEYSTPKVTIDLVEYNFMRQELKRMESESDAEGYKTIIAELTNAIVTNASMMSPDIMNSFRRRMSRFPIELIVRESGRRFGELTKEDISIVVHKDKIPT